MCKTIVKGILPTNQRIETTYLKSKTTIIKKENIPADQTNEKNAPERLNE